MDTPIVKFNKLDQPDFFKELRKRVNNYFEENNISKKANSSMKIKTVFMIALYFIPFAITCVSAFGNVTNRFLFSEVPRFSFIHSMAFAETVGS